MARIGGQESPSSHNPDLAFGPGLLLRPQRKAMRPSRLEPSFAARHLALVPSTAAAAAEDGSGMNFPPIPRLASFDHPFSGPWRVWRGEMETKDIHMLTICESGDQISSSS